MEDEDGEDLTPFWVKSNTNVHRRVTTTFFSFGLVVFLLLVTAVFFLFFVVPSFISVSAKIIKPNSVKNSWDSLNIILVLVAVLFGFLSRNRNEDRYNSYYDDFQASPSKQNGSQIPSTMLTPNRWYKYSHSTTEGQKSNSSNSSQWCEYSDYQAKLEHKNSFLMKNSRSYPDLPETSTTHWSSYGDYYQRRYYDDDIRVVDSGRFRDTGLDRDLGQGKIHRRHRSLEGVEHLRAPQKNKTVIVDTLPSKSKEGANLPPQETEAMAEAPLGIEEKSKGENSATGRHTSSTKLDKEFLQPAEEDPPQQPPEAAEQMEFTENPEFTYERNGRQKERSNRERKTDLESRVPVSTRPHDAPSPPSPPRQRGTYRKRTSTTGRDFLNSLYNKNKKKQSVDNLYPLLPETQAPLSFQVPPPSHPPPPPPAPPPPSVFQNLFIPKKHKRKRTITVTLEPQAPLPLAPPPPREPEPTTPLPTRNPQNPIKMTPFEKLEETSNSGDEFPLNRISPAPPPPDAFYKIPVWKFVVQGDYVRVNSGNSSRSGSDDGESDVTPSSAGAGGATPFHPSPFRSSPDVDTKAESFITNFRAKLKLEKIHSMKKRNVGLSGLGPGPGPDPGPSQFS